MKSVQVAMMMRPQESSRSLQGVCKGWAEAEEESNTEEDSGEDVLRKVVSMWHVAACKWSMLLFAMHSTIS